MLCAEFCNSGRPKETGRASGEALERKSAFWELETSLFTFIKSGVGIGSHCCCERRQEWIRNDSAIARGRTASKGRKAGLGGPAFLLLTPTGRPFLVGHPECRGSQKHNDL